MDEVLAKYRALSVEDKRAADLCCRPHTNNRSMGEMFDAGIKFTVQAVDDAV